MRKVLESFDNASDPDSLMEPLLSPETFGQVPLRSFSDHAVSSDGKMSPQLFDFLSQSDDSQNGEESQSEDGVNTDNVEKRKFALFVTSFCFRSSLDFGLIGSWNVAIIVTTTSSNCYYNYLVCKLFKKVLPIF